MTDLVLGQKLSDAAREYANATIAALPIPSGVHPPTVVADGNILRVELVSH